MVKYILSAFLTVILSTALIAMQQPLPSDEELYEVLAAFEKAEKESLNKMSDQQLETLIKTKKYSAPAFTQQAATFLAQKIFKKKTFISEPNKEKLLKMLRVSDLNMLSGENAIAVNDDHGLLAYITPTGTIKLLNLHKGFESSPSSSFIHSAFSMDPVRINSLAFSNDGKLLASANRLGQVIIWNVPSHHHNDVLEIHDLKQFFDTNGIHGIETIAFHPDGKQIAAGYSYNRKIYMLGLDANKKLTGESTLLVDTQADITNLGFNESGSLLAVRFRSKGQNSSPVNLIDVKTHKLLLPETYAQKPSEVESKYHMHTDVDQEEKQEFKKLLEELLQRGLQYSQERAKK